MTLHEAIEQVLLSRSCTTFADLSKAVQAHLKRRRPNEVIFNAFMEYLFDTHVTDIAFNKANNTIIYREQLFENAVFRLDLFEEEIAGGYLIIPGRFVPFFHSIPKKEKLHFVDDNEKQLPVVKMNLPLYESDALTESLHLLPPYAELDIKMNYADAKVTVPVIDLKEWLVENPMNPKDQLLVTTLDYSKHRYRLQRVTAKELSSDRLLIKSADKTLLNHLTDYLDHIENPTPIDHTLFCAFATISPDEHPVFEKPGSPISLFVRNQENIQMYTHADFPFLHFSDYMQNYLDDMLLEDVLEPPPGSAVELTDILFEMGSSSSKEYFAGKMIQQIQSSGNYDLVAISDKVFSYSPFNFANKKQEKNYEKAIAKLEKEVKAKWSGKKMSLPLSQALNRALSVKEGVMEFIHDTVEHQIFDMEHTMTILYQIRQIDNIVDQILENITTGPQISPDQARELADQLNFMKNSFQDLVAAFEEDM